MFGLPRHLYVYFTYGMHYCMNIVCGPEGQGSAVLIRAIEPLEGAAIMQQNRGGKTGIELTNGPAKVCYALQIDRDWNGHDLRNMPLQLQIMPTIPDDTVMQTVRIGISQAKDVPWRFFIRDNPYVSKP
jgi:DNA-3-methyladenine glycosylase